MISDYIDIRIMIIIASMILIGVLVVVRMILVKIILRKDVLTALRLIIGKEEIQEDAVTVVETEKGILGVLADGLGKKEVGRISSECAVKVIKDLFIAEGSKDMQNYFFNKAYNKANHEIISRVDSEKGGTSVLTAIIVDGYLHYALVGDAMLSIFRRNELYKISKGHSIDVVAENQYLAGKIEKNKAVSVLKDKKLLYYLGQASYGEIEINEEPIKLYKDDIVVLSSKGVYNGIRWIELENILRGKKSIDEICEDIISKVDKKNNGSILLMKYTLNNR